MANECCIVCGGVLSGRQRKYCGLNCASKAPPAEQRLCPKCNRHKSIKSFNLDPSRKDGYYPWCKVCRKSYIRSSSIKSHKSDDNTRLCLTCKVGIGGSHPNVKYCGQKCKSKASLARTYGLTIDEYQTVIDSTGGKCPICLKRTQRWCMDHKHDTGETFGPVCNACNTKLIAWTFHDPEVARRLVEFIENPPVRKLFGPKFVTQKKTTVDYGDPTPYKRRGRRVRKNRL